MRLEAEPTRERPGKGSAPAGERGIALVAAMLVLLFLALIATGMIVSVNTETKLASTGLRSDQALNTAEAGIKEALERIRIGDVPNSMDPLMVSQIFLCPAGSVPVVGADTTALATWQPEDSWLHYTTESKSADVLTIHYKTNAQRTRVYRYDTTKNPAIQTNSGVPIYVIESTAYHGTARRKVVTEVVPQPIRPNCKGAVVSGFELKVNSNSVNLCGFDHRGDTPVWTGVYGRTTSGALGEGCNIDAAIDHWESDPGTGDRAGGWAADNFAPNKGVLSGSPAGVLPNQAASNFYKGPWDALGMTQAEFVETLGPPQSVPAIAGNFNGIRYIKPPLGTLAVNGGTGAGLLYIDGNVDFKGSVTYRGMIYCTGELRVFGPFWALGSVISKNHMKLYSNDPCAILLSREAISNFISRYVGNFQTISWREH